MKLNKALCRLSIPYLATCCLLACTKKPAEKDESLGGIENTMQTHTTYKIGSTSMCSDRAPSAAKVASIIIANGYEWKDHKLRGGRLVKLFAAPEFPADSTHHYSIKENGRLYFIRVSQYGKSWIGSVLDNTEDEEKSFELITAPSLDDCLQLIRKQHGFTGELKKLLMD